MSGLMFMAMPETASRAAMNLALENTGLKAKLGATLFHPDCWHQSLSNDQDDSPEMLERFVDAGDSVTAAPFVLTLNRLSSQGSTGAIHWALRSTRAPQGLIALQQSIRTALQARGIREDHGHTAHVTISYRAPTALPTIQIQPVHWTINEFLLVRGGGKPYRYEVFGRWPLSGQAESNGGQLDLL